MKKNYLILVGLLVISCSEIPRVYDLEVNDTVQAFEKSKWMDKEDYVRYVNFFSRSPSNSGSVYSIIGDCDGYPSINVKTAPGFCLGLISDGAGLKKPRTAAAVSANQIVLTDMGSWNPYDGRIFLLSFENGKSTLKKILSKESFNSKDPRREIINRPHQITLHSDGKYYVGSSTSLLRFNPLAENIVESIEVLISNLPAEGLHPLKSFVFDDNGFIFINVGAATNVCHKNSSGAISGNHKNRCEEVENLEIGQGQIRRYKLESNGKVSTHFDVYAKGLRNSVALVWDSQKGVLIQGENSRDAIEKNDFRINGQEFPHDEINLIEEGKHYGWPYCYDNNLNSPEWKNVKCTNYQRPFMFLPAHSAPLAFSIYKGDLFPEWYKDRLIASLHGYEAKGHRIVTFKRNTEGFPTGIPQSIVYGWDTRGEQKMGSPVGLTELPDGSVIIVEDNNQKILRLFYDASKGNGKPIQEIDKTPTTEDPSRGNEEERRRLKLIRKIEAGNAAPFTLFQAKVIDKTCYSCHGGVNAPGIQLLRYDDEGNEMRLIKANKELEIYSMVSGQAGFPQMPPQGFSSEAEKKEASALLKEWIDSREIK